MKASLIKLLCFFLLLQQASWATGDSHIAETVHHDVVDCSGDYLDMEHKLNLAYDLLLDADIDQSLSLYEKIETSLENDEMPIRERICIANRVSKGYYDLYEDEKGLVFASKYLNKAKESLAPDDYLLGKAYESLGALQRRTDDFDSSKENLIHAFEILKSYSHQFLIYHQLGRFYLDTDQLQKSDKFFKLAVDNFDTEDKSLRNIRDQFYVYFGYAITGILTRDYAKAEQRTKRLDALSKKINDPFFNFLVNLKYTEYFLNGIPKTDTALVYLNKPVPDHPFVDHYKASHYYYFGVTRIIEGEYEKARDFFLRAIENSLSIGGDAQKIGQFYIWLARSYSNMNEPDKTLQAYQDALSYFDETKEKLRTTFAQIENNIGVLYFDQHELGHAKSHYLKSLAWKTERPNLRIRTGTNLVKVHLEYFKETKEERHIDTILNYMDLNDELMLEMRVKHRYYSDQLAVEYLANDLQNNNLEVLEYLFNSSDKYSYLIDRIFKYVEGVKTYSFKKELKEQEGLHTFGVPDELIEKINQEKSQVKLLQDEIYKLKSQNSKPYAESVSKDIIFGKEEQLAGLIDTYNATLLSVEMNYPNYFNYKFNNGSVSIEDVQKTLKPNEAFIEYFSSDTSIFIISIEDNAVNYINKRKSEDWEKTVIDYAHSVTKSEYQHQDSTAITYTKFVDSSHDLYNFILKDALDVIDEEVTHLTIVPDEQLHFVQFDNLLTQKVGSVKDYKDLDYLIHDYTISRSESAFIYFNSKNKARRHKKYKYIGFAPKYNNDNLAIVDSLESDRQEKAEYLHDLAIRGDYNDLPSARKSVDLITSMLSGISFIGNEASKQTFLERSHEGNILHFAGHAIVDKEPEFSQLLFSNVNIDSQLYASDIYNMDLDIDLVVLSACNTGNGKTKYGEGVMSLSRAFKFAGCSSMVMSLWNIPDVQTAEIDNYFFRNIQNGERIDDALRNSKLKFLKEATYQTAHPFYWSGMTASGKMEPVKRLSLLDQFCNFLKSI